MKKNDTPSSPAHSQPRTAQKSSPLFGAPPHSGNLRPHHHNNRHIPIHLTRKKEDCCRKNGKKDIFRHGELNPGLVGTA
jgi:hypothetical protein